MSHSEFRDPPERGAAGAESAGCLLSESTNVNVRAMSIGSMIEVTPETCGGRARVAGTRVPVHRIARYYQMGYSPEEMLGLLNSLCLSQIYAAVAYALANPEEIQTSLREEDDAAGQLSPQHDLA